VTPPHETTAKSTPAADTALDVFIAEMKMNKTVETVDAWAQREANNIVEKLGKRDQDRMQAAYEEWRNERAARAPAGEKSPI
jgi:hypothetical protein